MSFLTNCYKSYFIIAAILASLLFLGRIDVIAFGIILLYWTGIKIFTFHENKILRSIIVLLVIAISLGLLSHKIPGFHNILFFDGIRLSTKSAPYTSYINFDKPFLVLLLMYHYNRRKLYETKFASAFIYGLLLGIVAAATLSILSVYAKFIKFDPKIPEILGTWTLMNIVTILAEEAFFRGFLQTSLTSGLKKYNIRPACAGFISVTIVSILFGLAHFAGGTNYMIISGVAGAFYGYALYKTGMIESSILVHFLVNLTHICLFTYPTISLENNLPLIFSPI